MSELVAYRADQVPFVWDQVKGHIQKALDEGSEYTLDRIYAGLVTSKMQLWAWQDSEIHASMVTTIQIGDKITYCLLLTIGGARLNEWAGKLPIVENWAKQNGCEELRIYGRIGWAKRLDFEIMHTAMRKRI